MSKQGHHNRSVTKAKSINSGEIIDPQAVDTVVEDLVAGKKDPRWQKFLCFWIFGLSAKSAALKAGYSRSYAESGVQKRLKDPKVRAQLEAILSNAPQRYRAICRLRLVDIAQVEGALLEQLKDDPEKLLKHPAAVTAVKQIKQSSGVLGHDQQPPMVVNIGAMQNLMAQIIESKENTKLVTEDIGGGMVNVHLVELESETDEKG